MSHANDSGENSATLKRRDDKFLTIRVILDVLIIVVGFWLGNTILTVNATLREHDKAIEKIQTTIEERTKAHEEQIREVKAVQSDTVSRLDKAIEKLTDKVDKIAEKIGAK